MVADVSRSAQATGAATAPAHAATGVTESPNKRYHSRGAVRHRRKDYGKSVARTTKGMVQPLVETHKSYFESEGELKLGAAGSCGWEQVDHIKFSGDEHKSSVASGQNSVDNMRKVKKETTSDPKYKPFKLTRAAQVSW
ncbi:uncharacterized protein PITG_10340 [Phytophthora infestans T30-4]|uniref:Uncharacterized protein n=2 Tax=Phytophthora infestans (strain T30-4) TaxID=403677 RepID=D0NF37_PHYIT|nr:uncharacterized protein PITG_10340 [Phytophthora infestans T30-4]EEY56826.1 conserved hypothetical protein [Phytophthora infestans T30-4]|eukprot:XP_002902154.1 conserved hypothetical protein [Phytophthora infestans T30-4]